MIAMLAFDEVLSSVRACAWERERERYGMKKHQQEVKIKDGGPS